MRVVVVGAGVSGTFTAYCVQRAVPGAEVTVVAEAFTPRTVSDISPGLWKPHPDDNNPVHLQQRWGDTTFEHLAHISRTEDAAHCGVALVSGYFLYEEFKPRPFWADTVHGFRDMTPGEVRRYPGHTHGHAFSTYLCESIYYLPYITSKFQELGGRLVEKKLLHLEEVFSEADVVVNCSGVGAHDLARDPDILPIKGQLLRGKAPWVKRFVIGTDHHVFPGRDYVVMGGVSHEGNWNNQSNVADDKRILQGCINLEPSLKHAEIVNSRAGLRPGRSSIRLELEWRKHGNRSVPVVHNYGHGGSGVTFHWGCAQDATSLVQQALRETQSQRAQSKL